MAPLIVQLLAWAAFWAAGRAGVLPAAAAPAGALRLALAVMFAFTALSHFAPRTRAELVRMVPPALPAPALLVSLTGVLELAGAVGLLVPPLVRWAALALAALLVALFPANVRAHRAGLQIAGRRATPILPRLLLQLFWIGCLLRVAAADAPLAAPVPAAHNESARRGTRASDHASHAFMDVRPYTSPDHSEWLRMRRALWPHHGPEAEEQDAASWLARADAAVLVAVRPGGGGLAGFAEVGARDYADGCETSPVAYLEGWYVDSDVRRGGVGAALVRAAEAWARERGYAELASDALLEHDVSQRAHGAPGFAEVERSVKYRKAL
jgi:uncharacterized membrane protein/GNAT superfamily N-acetyltransferase